VERAQPDPCLFCQIVGGGVPAHVVHEDGQTMAFLDINPATEGHTLVVPRVHSDDLMHADADTAAAVMRSARAVAILLDRQLAPDGITVFQANRPAGWQDVFHLHVHVVPRWDDDDLVRPWSARPAGPEALRRTAERLRRR
jgi:histidine triad (HIT) family protein